MKIVRATPAHHTRDTIARIAVGVASYIILLGVLLVAWFALLDTIYRGFAVPLW